MSSSINTSVYALLSAAAYDDFWSKVNQVLFDAGAGELPPGWSLQSIE